MDYVRIAQKGYIRIFTKGNNRQDETAFTVYAGIKSYIR